jgi:hypothetical protein
LIREKYLSYLYALSYKKMQLYYFAIIDLLLSH